MDKPGRIYARPLSDVLRKTIKDVFAKQGFAATELVTRWPEIVGPRSPPIAEPEKIQWPRPYDGEDQAARHAACCGSKGRPRSRFSSCRGPILERVNQFFGWQAVTDLRLRQAPLTRRKRPSPTAPDTEAAERIAATLTEIADDRLRAALGRLGAAVEKP